MMDKIFQDYFEEVLPGEEKLLEAFSKYSGHSIKWLSGEETTIKDLVNRICDEFHEAGFDLDTLPIENILDKFLEYEPTMKPPAEYVRLTNLKNKILEQVRTLESNEAFLQHGGYGEIKKQFDASIADIESKIQDLL